MPTEPIQIVTRLLIGVLFASLLANFSLAADIKPPRAAKPTVPADISVQAYGRHNPKCVAWTDGCVNCSLGSCSNIGIACQPREIVCTEKSPEADK